MSDILLLKKLREATEASFSDCKNALAQADGDYDTALAALKAVVDAATATDDAERAALKATYAQEAAAASEQAKTNAAFFAEAAQAAAAAKAKTEAQAAAQAAAKQARAEQSGKVEIFEITVFYTGYGMVRVRAKSEDEALAHVKEDPSGGDEVVWDTVKRREWEYSLSEVYEDGEHFDVDLVEE